MSPPLVEARRLGRSYRTFTRRPGLWGGLRDLFARGELRPAVHDLDLEIHAGERVALLGRNGAGKSTTVKLICGILEPTSGHLTVAGRAPTDDRAAHVRQIGVVFGQRTGLWWDLPVQEAFALQSAVFRLSPADSRARIDELSDLLELRPLLGLPVRELSLGQRVRCDLAAALLHRPRLLLLDEPTIGLDVGVKRRLRAFLRGLADHGVTVLLTTHDLVDVAAVCDRVVLLDAGRVRFDGSVAGLRAAHGAAASLRIEGVGPPPASLVGAEALADGTWTARVPVDAGEPPSAAAAALLGRLHAAGVVPTGLSVEEPDLEAVVAAAQGAGGPP